jgi:adenine phosphoribosyltransferase
MDLKPFIREIPDFPKPGILFRDITPLLADSQALAATIDQLAERASAFPFDSIAGIESRGFVFATALAVRMGKGFVPIRKPGKLPYKVHREEYALEYGSDAVEVHLDGFEAGQRILLVDDLLATGGTMGAACRLVTTSGALVACCLFVIELGALEGRSRLPDVPTEALITY